MRFKSVYTYILEVRASGKVKGMFLTVSKRFPPKHRCAISRSFFAIIQIFHICFCSERAGMHCHSSSLHSLRSNSAGSFPSTYKPPSLPPPAPFSHPFAALFFPPSPFLPPPPSLHPLCTWFNTRADRLLDNFICRMKMFVVQIRTVSNSKLIAMPSATEYGNSARI